MAKKLSISGTIGGDSVVLVDFTSDEMAEEILRLNNVLCNALRDLRSLSNSTHPALESARFTLIHGGSHRKRQDRGGWNTPKKRT